MGLSPMPGPDPSVVKDLQFFRDLDDAEVRAVLAAARTRRIPRKEAAFTQGAPANEFFVLLHGHLKVVQATPDGRQVILRIVAPGEAYGIAVAMGRADYPATAVALEDCVTLAWPSSAWASLVQRAPQLAANALAALGQRVGEAHARIREVSTEDVERRVAHLLLRLIEAGGCGSAAIGFPITRKEIAEMTGTTLFTVSRILSDWEKQGLVAGRRERILIMQARRLSEIAEGDGR
jgi:CRP/FNR family transcriptional regulator, nitrogen oxide reductase regulator